MGKGGRQTERRDCVKPSQLGVMWEKVCYRYKKQNPLPSTEVGKSSIDENKITQKNRFTLVKICESKVMK